MSRSTGTVGAKTLKLKELKDLGLNVPDFKSISAEQIGSLISKDGIADLLAIKILAKEIDDEMKCKKYAVRSSALIEDSAQESFAGQFKTVVDVEKQDLAKAIEEVATFAYKILEGSIEKFSIIVQQYIDADFAGVTFTRNPLSGREMVIEYHKGKGEDLVSGKIKPETVLLYWNTPIKEFLPGASSAVANFKRVEEHYKWPQDIEWCIKDGQWYFLQTRPVTTLEESEYQQDLYLDEVLPNDKKFYFAKNEISEIAPRPTEFTMSLLDKVYSVDGPIKRVYEKYKISYECKELFKIFGNELFIDKEEELKSLLPMYTYFKNTELTPSWEGFSGFFRTVGNLFYIHKISIDGEEKLLRDLKDSLNENLSKELVDALAEFLKKYELVFEINLLANAATKKLEASIRREKIDLALVLAFGQQIVKEDLELEFSSKNILGNSLDIADESDFTINKKNEKENEELKTWWQALPEWKKNFLQQRIQKAVAFNRLREIARWLVVKHVNNFREILFRIAEKKNFKEKRDVYFASVEELQSLNFREEDCQKRKLEFEKYLQYTLPRELVYKPIFSSESLQGVSPGIAEGILVTGNEINEENYKDKKKILFTKILSPDLTKYFDQIEGIISEQGGMLSHLAIMARENGLPVVVGFKGKMETGKHLKIDGAKGKIF